MLTPITAPTSPLYPDVSRIYLDAFPPAERRPLQKMHRLMEVDDRFRLMAIVCDAGAVLGLMAAWTFPTFRYVEYLAVDAERRGQQIGSMTLGHWLNTSPLPIILEVEPPVDELTHRRISFYERIGFKLLPHPYLQPSYGEVPGLPLRLMQWGDAELDVERVIQTLHREVYGVRE